MSEDTTKVKIEFKKIKKVGGSIMITLPKEFLEEHGLGQGDELLMIANSRVMFINPKDRLAKKYVNGIEKDLGTCEGN